MTTAIYPSAVRTFVEHDDYVELVDASHVNDLQDEVNAIEGTLGTNPMVYAPAGARPTSYRTVGARLDSHEAAIAAQQTVIGQILDAEKQGWQAPSISVTGPSNPAVRLLAGADLLATVAPSPVSWTGVAVDIGDMYVPNANTVTMPKSGLWLTRATISATVDWATLDATQTYYNNLGIKPVPLAYQRLGFYLYLGSFLADYEYAVVHWTPASERPSTSLSINIPLGFFGVSTSGTQIKVATEQYYGHMTGAAVTMTATFQQTVAGVS